MRKTILLTMLAMLGMTQAVAQEYEYVPFVREGVKWMYIYYEDIYPLDDHGKLLNLEIKGDTVINSKTYKLMHKYYGDSINTNNDTVPVCLREENKVVYAFVPNGIVYDDCRVGNLYKSSDADAIREGREFILYDFNNPIAFIRAFSDSLGANFEHLYTDIITVGERLFKRYGINVEGLGVIDIIEGIGMRGSNSYPLSCYNLFMYGFPYWALINVIEDGETIFDLELAYDVPDVPYNHEYVPFVRDGVQWVYYYDNPFRMEILDMDEGIQYYSFEMKGDVVIGDKHYKQVCLTRHLNEFNTVVEDFIPVYLREEDKVVYAIQPDGINYPQCPVGIGKWVSESFDPEMGECEEFVLYDFNDPITLYSEELASHDFQYRATDYVNIGPHVSKRHQYKTHRYTSDNDVIIEGIGFDSPTKGTPLFYFNQDITGLQVGYFLSHVVENGEIIYKGAHYKQNPSDGIDEVAEGQQLRADGNYYDLMGRTVGGDLPTTPGIYIHQGKKIIIR